MFLFKECAFRVFRVQRYGMFLNYANVFASFFSFLHNMGETAQKKPCKAAGKYDFGGKIYIIKKKVVPLRTNHVEFSDIYLWNTTSETLNRNGNAAGSRCRPTASRKIPPRKSFTY